MNTLYVKRGRRYEVFGNAEQFDLMRAGQWRLTYCYRDGGRRFAYDVRPDSAGFVAAAQLAAVAMEEAITKAAAGTPDHASHEYTPAQLAALEKARADLMAAGLTLPTWWRMGSAHEIAQAVVDAVRSFAP